MTRRPSSLPPSRAAERGALLLQKAGFLIDAERFEEARDCFAQLAKMAPQSAGPQNGLAAAYAGLGSSMHRSRLTKNP